MPSVDEVRPARCSCCGCLSESKGGSSFENLLATSRHQVSVAAIPPVWAAFRATRHRRHVLEGVSRPWGAVYPIASLLRSPRSVHPVLAATRGLGWRAGGVKLRDLGGQMHRREDLLGDVLG